MMIIKSNECAPLTDTTGDSYFVIDFDTMSDDIIKRHLQKLTFNKVKTFVDPLIYPAIKQLLENNNVDILLNVVSSLKQRMPELETLLIKNNIAQDALSYIFWINLRIPKLEQVILNNPEISSTYASLVIRGRWPEGENIIKQDAVASLSYATRVIKGRWKEAEDIISSTPLTAFNYARYVLNRRWLRAEPIIRENKNRWSHYKQIFQI